MHCFIYIWTKPMKWSLNLEGTRDLQGDSDNGPIRAVCMLMLGCCYGDKWGNSRGRLDVRALKAWHTSKSITSDMEGVSWWKQPRGQMWSESRGFSTSIIATVSVSGAMPCVPYHSDQRARNEMLSQRRVIASCEKGESSESNEACKPGVFIWPLRTF